MDRIHRWRESVATGEALACLLWWACWGLVCMALAMSQGG